MGACAVICKESLRLLTSSFALGQFPGLRASPWRGRAMGAQVYLFLAGLCVGASQLPVGASAEVVIVIPDFHVLSREARAIPFQSRLRRDLLEPSHKFS